MTAPIAPVAPITPDATPAAAADDAPGGFAAALADAVGDTAQAESVADELGARFAAGEAVAPHELMLASNEALLGIETLSAVRDTAINAYQEIMAVRL